MSITGKSSIVDIPTHTRRGGRWAPIMAALQSAASAGKAVFLESSHPAGDRNSAVGRASKLGLKIRTRIVDKGLIIWVYTEGAEEAK